MTLIDIAAYRELGFECGVGDILPLYYDRVEGVVGGWRCRSCHATLADCIPFGPPPLHECAAFKCSWCEGERGQKTEGSHGICPRHFIVNLLPKESAKSCARCRTEFRAGMIAHRVSKWHDATEGGAGDWVEQSFVICALCKTRTNPIDVKAVAIE